LRNFLPILDWLPQYPRAWLRSDLIAGLTAGAVVIPKAMAFAAIAGLPIETGLYSAFVPLVVYAILGTSRRLSVSSTTIIALLTAAEIGIVVPGGGPAEMATAAATIAFLVGIILVGASLLRLGFIADFISDPVLSGFKAGIGLVIVVDQVPKLLGLHPPHGSFFSGLAYDIAHLASTSIPTLAVGFATLVVILGLEYRLPRIPAPLLAVAAGIVASAVLGLAGLGVAIVGPIPAGLPSLSLPDLSLVAQLWPGAMGIALMSFVESIAAGRSFTAHGELRPEANQELLALGLANIAGAIFRALPAGGGTSQTAVNQAAGARSQIAALATAVLAVAVMLFLAPVIGLMPQATLAAVVIATSVGLVNLPELDDIRRIRKQEFWWALIAIAGVLTLGTLKGILVAIIASLLSLMHQANRPPLYALRRKPGTDAFRPLSDAHPDDEIPSGLLILRTEGRVYFANAHRVGDKMWPLIHAAKPKVLILDCSAIPDIEYTALRMLTEAEEKLREGGTALWLVALNPAMLDVVERSPLGTRLGHQRMFFDLATAVAAYESQVSDAGMESDRMGPH
jgi:SulP family sulfate permease